MESIVIPSLLNPSRPILGEVKELVPGHTVSEQQSGPGTGVFSTQTEDKSFAKTRSREWALIILKSSPGS